MAVKNRKSNKLLLNPQKNLVFPPTTLLTADGFQRIVIILIAVITVIIIIIRTVTIIIYIISIIQNHSEWTIVTGETGLGRDHEAQ